MCGCVLSSQLFSCCRIGSLFCCLICRRMLSSACLPSRSTPYSLLIRFKAMSARPVLPLGHYRPAHPFAPSSSLWSPSTAARRPCPWLPRDKTAARTPNSPPGTCVFSRLSVHQPQASSLSRYSGLPWVRSKSLENFTCSDVVFLLVLSVTSRSMPVSLDGTHTLTLSPFGSRRCCSMWEPTRYSPAWMVNRGCMVEVSLPNPAGQL